MGRAGLAMLGVAVVLGSPLRADDVSRLKLATAVVDTAHVGDTMRSLQPIS